MLARGRIRVMRGWSALGVLVLLAFVSACAPRTVPLPPPGPPAFPDFVRPTVPVDLRSSAAARQTDRSWAFLQAGDFRTAEREAAAALKSQPSFYPAQAANAYILLARKDARGAAAQFARIADAHPQYVPALVGKGLALAASDQNAEAVAAFRAALRIDPSLADVARRVEVLTLRGLQEELAAARQAARNGDPEAAIRAYQNAIAASPDSAFLYRELAAVERQQGQVPTAIAHLRKAIELDPGDAASLVMLGDLLDQQGDLAGAEKAYSDALSLEPNPDVEAKRAAVNARLELAALPEQYRAIENTPQVTRGELAALIGVRLGRLVQTGPIRDTGVLTDVRGNWAERWIAPVARAGIIEALPNHTFQPRAPVRRVDLAQAVSRLLSLVAAVQPARAQTWVGARGRFSDMSTGHIAYPAASVAVAAGGMQTVDGAFQPTGLVSGAEAAAAIDRIRSLAGVVATTASDRR
jgi:tetratricopeptide (TPR) repeat protein